MTSTHHSNASRAWGDLRKRMEETVFGGGELEQDSCGRGSGGKGQADRGLAELSWMM